MPIAVILSYFESQPDLKNSDDARQDFAKYMLENLRFLYLSSDGSDKKASVPYIVFTSPVTLILDTEI